MTHRSDWLIFKPIGVQTTLVLSLGFYLFLIPRWITAYSGAITLTVANKRILLSILILVQKNFACKKRAFLTLLVFLENSIGTFVGRLYRVLLISTSSITWIKKSEGVKIFWRQKIRNLLFKWKWWLSSNSKWFWKTSSKNPILSHRNTVFCV